MWEGVRGSAEAAVREGIEHLLLPIGRKRTRRQSTPTSNRCVPGAQPAPGGRPPGAAAERGKKLFESERIGCSEMPSEASVYRLEDAQRGLAEPCRLYGSL